MRVAAFAFVLVVTGSWLPLVAADHAGVHEVVQADLHDVRWSNGQADRTGVSGVGPPVLHVEGFDSEGHEDLVECRFDAYVEVAGHAQSLSNSEMPIGTQGHGTWTGGSVCGQGRSFPHPGVATGARLLNWNSWYSGDSSEDQWGLQEDHGPRVLTHSTLSDPKNRWTPLEEGADLAVFWAAGNSGGDGVESETVDTQGDPRYVVVAATTHDGTAVASYSSRGTRNDDATWPDLAAPGCRYVPHPATQPFEVVRRVVMPGDPAAGDCPEDEEERQTAQEAGYLLVWGTSFAAPTAAGVAALVLEVHPEVSTQDLRELLFQTADPFLPAEDLDGDGAVSPDEFYEQHGWQAGHGLVNATGAVAAAHHMARYGGDVKEAVACAWIDETDEGRVLNPTHGCPSDSAGAPQDAGDRGPDGSLDDDNSTKPSADLERHDASQGLLAGTFLFLGCLLAVAARRRQNG